MRRAILNARAGARHVVSHQHVLRMQRKKTRGRGRSRFGLVLDTASVGAVERHAAVISRRGDQLSCSHRPTKRQVTRYPPPTMPPPSLPLQLISRPCREGIQCALGCLFVPGSGLGLGFRVWGSKCLFVLLEQTRAPEGAASLTGSGFRGGGLSGFESSQRRRREPLPQRASMPRKHQTPSPHPAP